MRDDFSFFSFNKESDWEKGCSDNLIITQKGISIRQTEKYVVDATIDLKRLTGVATVLDFTLAKNGRIFLLDERLSVWGYDEKTNYLELFIKSDVSFSEHSSLASSADILFIADPIGGLYAFSISNGQILWTKTEWDGRPFYPLAIKAHSDGYLYCLIVDEMEGNFVKPSSIGVVKLNLAGKEAAFYENRHWQIQAKKHFLEYKYRYLLAISKQNTPMIFDQKQKQLYRLFADNETYHDYPVQFQSKQAFSGFFIDANDYLLFGDRRREGHLGEDDRFIRAYDINGNELFSITSYRGRADKIEMDRNERLYVLDRYEEKLTILEKKWRTMEREGTKLLEGTILFKALDTQKEKVIWHRVLLERTLPEETQIHLYYYASDEKNIMVGGKIVDIDAVIGDATKSFSEKEKLLEPLWTKRMDNPRDALFFEAKGRYLWLKIHLIGTEKETPSIHKMRVYFPRLTYLSYLPAVYREDEESRDFLERFLSLFSTFLMDMEEKIDHIPNYFDVNLVSGDFLRWLSTWLGIASDDSWSDEQIRQLLLHAPFLYKRRGTKKAIEKIVEIYTGKKPYIIEHFQLKKEKQNSELYNVIKNIYGDHPYYFYVLIEHNTLRSEKEKVMLQKLLDAEKPAYTEAKLVVLEPWIYLDMHSYLNINTYLTEKSFLRLNDRSYLPSDTVLIDVDRDRRIDIHTRLELDSNME